MQARADGNDVYAQELIQGLANVRAQRRALDAEVADYIRAANPPAPEPETDQEWRNKPAHKMNYDDVVRMAGKSKYGIDENAFRAGIEEVRRRRARGE